MSNPTISFRLSTYQLARGLQIIRKYEPDYQPTNISKIVKLIYLDYLAKMTMYKPDKDPQYYIDEIESIIYKTRKSTINFKEFQQEINISNEDEKSVKTNVEDFSPPKEWLE